MSESFLIITKHKTYMGMIGMKVHQLARGLWSEAHEVPSTLSLGCKRLRPLAPKLIPNNSPAAADADDGTTTTDSLASFDLKCFIRPGCGPRKLASLDAINKDSSSSQVETITTTATTATHPGGTRWNPTQEQIGILEALYRGGMRTPNAQQIEQITSRLGKFGKIEGKNVFYWFQNHKARERQKQKRNSLGLVHSPRTPSPLITIALDTKGRIMERDREDSTSPYKRKFEWFVEDSYNADRSNRFYNNYRDNQDHNDHNLLGARTLELFPLRPEGR